MPSRRQKAGLGFTNLRDSWGRCKIGLLIERRVRTPVVRPVQLGASETRSLRTGDIQRLSPSKRRYLCSTSRILWENFIIYSKIRRKVRGHTPQPLKLAINRLKRTRYLLRIHTDEHPWHTLHFETATGK